MHSYASVADKADKASSSRIGGRGGEGRGQSTQPSDPSYNFVVDLKNTLFLVLKCLCAGVFGCQIHFPTNPTK